MGGLSGIVTQQAGGLFYKRNTSPLNTTAKNGVVATRASFGVVELIATQPSATLTGASPRFMDLGGDGRMDRVELDRPVRGFYERQPVDGQKNIWNEFQAFDFFPNLQTFDPNLKFLDIDGDGLTDILVSEDEVFGWYRSFGKAGFGPREYARKPFDEETGPAIVFADPPNPYSSLI
jgi:hypothetical protein